MSRLLSKRWVQEVLAGIVMVIIATISIRLSSPENNTSEASETVSSFSEEASVVAQSAVATTKSKLTPEKYIEKMQEFLNTGLINDWNGYFTIANEKSKDTIVEFDLVAEEDGEVFPVCNVAANFGLNNQPTDEINGVFCFIDSKFYQAVNTKLSQGNLTTEEKSVYAGLIDMILLLPAYPYMMHHADEEISFFDFTGKKQSEKESSAEKIYRIDIGDQSCRLLFNADGICMMGCGGFSDLATEIPVIHE